MFEMSAYLGLSVPILPPHQTQRDSPLFSSAEFLWAQSPCGLHICVTPEHTRNVLLFASHSGAREALRLSLCFPVVLNMFLRYAGVWGIGSPSLRTHTVPELVMLLFLPTLPVQSFFIWSENRESCFTHVGEQTTFFSLSF